MIATLSGVISEKLPDMVVLDVQGVGYGLYVTAEDHGRLSVGETTNLTVFEYVREQAHDLFGFLSRDTQNLFEQLLNVTGVGPRMALNILSIGSTAEVRGAIAGGDVKFIQQAHGAGKRAAERIVVELKDKVGLVGADLSASGILQSDEALRKDEAVEALVSLGFSPADAASALQGIDADLPTDQRVKQALSQRS